MDKIFTPINRWKFILYIFLFWIFTGLYTKFIMFFDQYGYSTFYILCIIFLIILFLVFKRLFDIYDKLWKSVIFTFFSFLLLVICFILSVTSVTYDSNGIATSNKILMLLYPLYSLILVLFLSLKNGKNSKFFNFEWKKVLKRFVLLLFIFSAYKFLTLSFDAILPTVDYRMYPAFEIQDRLLVSKITKRTALKREDVVCIKNNKGLPNPLRIVGLPNESIKLDGNKIYIDDKLYSDKYAFFSKNLKPINFSETINLDNNSYFLMGDNRYYDKSGQILKTDKNGNQFWKSIKEINSWSYRSENDGKIYLKLNKKDLFGKVIAVHYGKTETRNAISYSFAIKNKKFGFNSSSTFEKIFGKP